MKKTITLIGVLIVAGAKLATASGPEELRAAGGAGLTEPALAAITALSVEPASAPALEVSVKAAPGAKISVTPVTEHWKDVLLVKFNRGTDIKTVMDILSREGFSSKSFADNGDGFYVRLDVKDAAAAAAAMALAEYGTVESVQVNRAVYAILSGSKGRGNVLSRAAEVPAQKGTLKAINGILAAKPLPGGCSLEVNSYRSSYYGESLNVGILRTGDFTGILMSGEASVVPGTEGVVYRYESVSTAGAGTVWADHRIKNVFELRIAASGEISSVAIENYKEKKNFLGQAGWRKVEAVTCAD